jgi:hypothetical protein
MVCVPRGDDYIMVSVPNTTVTDGDASFEGRHSASQTRVNALMAATSG